MNFGIATFVTDLSMGPAELARAAEERGFYSMYVPEHTHIPTSRRTPSPVSGAILPEEYKHPLDPFVALAAAAAVTSRLKLGTAVSLIAQRDVLLTAKEVATLDLISGGRVVLGIGFGWNREEMEDHGVNFRQRRALVREKMLAMEKLWANEKAAFAGEFVRFEESWSWPKPVQRPRPPVVIGAPAGAHLFAHIAEYADGWMPIGGAGVRAALPDLQEAMRQAGRDPAQLKIILIGTIPTPDKIGYYESFGVSEIVLPVPSGPADVMLSALDGYMSLL